MVGEGGCRGSGRSDRSRGEPRARSKATCCHTQQGRAARWAHGRQRSVSVPTRRSLAPHRCTSHGLPPPAPAQSARRRRRRRRRAASNRLHRPSRDLLSAHGPRALWLSRHDVPVHTARVPARLPPAGDVEESVAAVGSAPARSLVFWGGVPAALLLTSARARCRPQSCTAHVRPPCCPPSVRAVRCEQLCACQAAQRGVRRAGGRADTRSRSLPWDSAPPRASAHHSRTRNAAQSSSQPTPPAPTRGRRPPLLPTALRVHSHLLCGPQRVAWRRLLPPQVRPGRRLRLRLGLRLRLAMRLHAPHPTPARPPPREACTRARQSDQQRESCTCVQWSSAHHVCVLAKPNRLLTTPAHAPPRRARRAMDASANAVAQRLAAARARGVLDLSALGLAAVPPEAFALHDAGAAAHTRPAPAGAPLRRSLSWQALDMRQHSARCRSNGAQGPRLALRRAREGSKRQRRQEGSRGFK